MSKVETLGYWFSVIPSASVRRSKKILLIFTWDLNLFSSIYSCSAASPSLLGFEMTLERVSSSISKSELGCLVFFPSSTTKRFKQIVFQAAMITLRIFHFFYLLPFERFRLLLFHFDFAKFLLDTCQISLVLFSKLLLCQLILNLLSFGLPSPVQHHSHGFCKSDPHNPQSRCESVLVPKYKLRRYLDSYLRHHDLHIVLDLEYLCIIQLGETLGVETRLPWYPPEVVIPSQPVPSFLDLLLLKPLLCNPLQLSLPNFFFPFLNLLLHFLHTCLMLQNSNFFVNLDRGSELSKVIFSPLLVKKVSCTDNLQNMIDSSL